MPYNVNEDKGDNSAIIHDDKSPRGTCHPQDKKPQNGQWYGPFLSKSDAWDCAKNTGRRTYGEDPHCLSGEKVYRW